MAGIYIHIPFCKQACHYCNFHFSTTLNLQAEMIAAIRREIEIKQDFFPDNPHIDTIYFGGGTPSLLGVEDIGALLSDIRRHFNVPIDVEITLEANPDDLSKEKIGALKDIGVNRLSIGIQSFDDRLLTYMNRAHRAAESVQCLEDCLNIGFDEISVDLIYGIPGLGMEQWEKELHRISDFSIHHLSLYALTVEPSTALEHFIRKKNWAVPDEEIAAKQFLMASRLLGNLGFDHYEISNYARDGHMAKHNTAYWKGQAYLGLGPSAHSFLPGKRTWNVANNAAYISALRAGKSFMESEDLSTAEQFNEYVMTGLRTKWGIDLDHIEEHFGGEFRKHILAQIANLDTKQFDRSEEKLSLTKVGWLYSDGISSSLFI